MYLNKKNYSIYLLIITVIYALPFLLSPYNFIDDVYRSSSGDLVVWYQNGRPLAVYFFSLLNASFTPSDPYPFSFILSFSILYFNYKSLVEKIISENNFFIKLSIYVLFLCNPFFLQNLSFKYDSLTMVMSIVCACLFVFNKKTNYIVFDYFVKSLIILALFCFYQSALSLVFGLLAIKMLIDVDRNKVSILITNLVLNLLCIIIVFFIYKICIANYLLSDGFNSAGRVLALDSNCFYNLFNNICGYLKLLSFFIYKKYILISIVVFSLLFVFTLIKDFKNHNYKKITALIICIPLLFIALTSCNIILAHPLFHMREMMGVSSVFVYLFLFIDKGKIIAKVTMILPCSFLLTSFLLSSAMCNLKRAEYIKNELVTQDVLKAINHFGINKVQGLAFISDDLVPPAEKIIFNNYALLNIIFDHNNFNSAWYANGIINGQYYLHKAVVDQHIKDFPKSLEILSSCYTQSAFNGVILYIKVGSLCNSLPVGFNAGVF